MREGSPDTDQAASSGISPVRAHILIDFSERRVVGPWKMRPFEALMDCHCFCCWPFANTRTAREQDPLKEEH